MVTSHLLGMASYPSTHPSALSCPLQTKPCVRLFPKPFNFPSLPSAPSASLTLPQRSKKYSGTRMYFCAAGERAQEEKSNNAGCKKAGEKHRYHLGCPFLESSRGLCWMQKDPFSRSRSPRLQRGQKPVAHLHGNITATIGKWK